MKKPNNKKLHGSSWPLQCSTFDGFGGVVRAAQFRVGPLGGRSGSAYSYAQLDLKDLNALRRWLDSVVSWIKPKKHRPKYKVLKGYIYGDLHCTTYTKSKAARARLEIDSSTAELDLKELRSLHTWLGNVIEWAAPKVEP
jgi:hypothetical protein